MRQMGVGSFSDVLKLTQNYTDGRDESRKNDVSVTTPISDEILLTIVEKFGPPTYLSGYSWIGHLSLV